MVRGGDPTFDAAIQVAAWDPAAAERLPARPAVRQALSELSSAKAAFVHNDCVYVMPYDDVLKDASAVRRLPDQVTAITAHLDQAPETDSTA